MFRQLIAIFREQTHYSKAINFDHKIYGVTVPSVLTTSHLYYTYSHKSTERYGFYGVYGILRVKSVLQFSYNSHLHNLTIPQFYYATGYFNAVAQWLRCCATNRKVARSIPDGVIGIFH